jgi:hypothetical protein
VCLLNSPQCLKNCSAARLAVCLCNKNIRYIK